MDSKAAGVPSDGVPAGAVPTTQQAPDPDDQLWDINDLSKYRKRSKASTYIDIKEGRLDPGILITPRCRRWLPSKVRVQA